MSDDLIKRLREYADPRPGGVMLCVDMTRAAAEIERLREERDASLRQRDDVRAELTSLQIYFEDWKVAHSTIRLEAEIERLRAEVERLQAELPDAAAVGELPEPARDADAPAAGLALSAVAGTVTANYQTCHENAEQLRALQVWVSEMAATAR